MSVLRRRTVLTGAVAAAAGLVGCSARSAGPARSAAPGGGQTAGVQPTRHAYGDDPSQFGELSLPTGPRRPGTVVVLHGGFWRSAYALDLGRPLAADLAARGWAAWNLEYRRIGSGPGGGGGWPATLADVAAGIDLLAGLGSDLDLDHVVTIGHSAGGQLAVWAAARTHLPAGSPGASPKVKVTAAVSQAGVLDLVYAQRTGVGGTAVSDLLGATPEQHPDRYEIASPVARVPLSVPVRCVHGRDDDTVPRSQSTRYVQKARAAGDDAELVEVDGDHFTLIDVTSPAWRAVVDRLPGLLT